MVQDVRSLGAQTPAQAVDLLSPQGVLQALQLVRVSTAPVAEKRELRDLIFSYSNSGGDQGLRLQLEERLRVLPIDATAAAAVASSPALKSADYGFAGSRPTPQFSVPVVTQVASQHVTPRVTPSVPVTNVAPSTTPVVARDAAAVPVVLPPVRTVPTSTPVSVVEPEPTTVKKVIVPTVPVMSPVTSTTAPATPLPSSPPTTPVMPASTTAPVPVPAAASALPETETPAMAAARDRIAIIKQKVNAAYGNPVNLNAKHKAIGSEYMAALLGAMKAVTNTGADPVAAMARLEAAFAAVEQLSAATATPAPSAPTAAPAVSPAAPAVAAAVYPPPLSALIQSEEPLVPVMPPGVATRAGDVPPVAPVTVESAVSPVGFASVAAAAPLLTPTDLPTAAEVKARSGITDPLLDPDVDAGLEQLLSEWVLFKKSGLFGSGPHGRAHPLFLKLAPLPMTMIVSGRFDGSAPDIKQSITDYMNGWRYEQGIVYNNDETFEHYLRRVIRHIIDLQRR